MKKNHINVTGYLNTVYAPWGQLFYQLIWHHLNFSQSMILDFGSGFGITANHMAESNRVIAIEPNKEMLLHRVHSHEYQQIVGGIEKLHKIPDETFDVIICHNVLEYVNHRSELLHEFYRILKKEGTLSLVKHHKPGKIMQKAVFEYHVEEAMSLLADKNTISANFGEINEYTINELENDVSSIFHIEKIYGVRMFYGLQKNDIKFESDWLSNMFQLECAAEEIPEFRDIAFFHHLLLQKKQKGCCHE